MSQSQSQSQSQRQQQARTSSHGKKSAGPHARPSKPPPLRRGASYNHPHPPSHSSTAAHSHSKSASGPTRKHGEREGVHHLDDEEGGMASFLQFCATCEKQIVTPGLSILYCSEVCRKQDVSRPASIQSLQSLESVKSPIGMSNAASYFDHPPADILPQRSPTVLRPASLTFTDPFFPDHTSSTHHPRDRSDYQRSESSSSLSQYCHDLSSIHARRPRVNRASTTTDTAIPSLVHSPSSSYGTIASNASYRPLAPRHNPFTTDCHHNKSIDLVIPYDSTAPPSPTQLLKDSSMKSCASTLTSYRIADPGEISYHRRSTPSRAPDLQASHSLKQLFSHDAMKAPP